MKDMKKLLTLALSGAVIAVPAVAMADTVSNEESTSQIKITSVDIAEDQTNTDCIKVTVAYEGQNSYTISKDTKQETVLGVKATSSDNKTTLLADPQSKDIVWIDQDAQEGTMSFLIKKTNLSDILYLKVGGTDVSIPQLVTLNTSDWVEKEAAPTITSASQNEGNLTVNFDSNWESGSGDDVAAYLETITAVNIKKGTTIVDTLDRSTMTLDLAKMDAALDEDDLSDTFTVEYVSSTYKTVSKDFTYTSADKTFKAEAKAAIAVTSTKVEEQDKYEIVIDLKTYSLKSATEIAVTDVTDELAPSTINASTPNHYIVDQDDTDAKKVKVEFTVSDGTYEYTYSNTFTVPVIGVSDILLDNSNSKIYTNEEVTYGNLKTIYTVKLDESIASGNIVKAFVGSQEVGDVFYSVQTGNFIVAIPSSVTGDVDLKACAGEVEEAAKIKVYADVEPDETVDGSDEFNVAMVSAELLTLPDIKTMITADVNNDGTVDGSDEFDIAMVSAELLSPTDFGVFKVFDN